jgi:hypothetical protein
VLTYLVYGVVVVLGVVLFTVREDGRFPFALDGVPFIVLLEPDRKLERDGFLGDEIQKAVAEIL